MKLRHRDKGQPLLGRPYRDAVMVDAVLAAVVIVVALATGGGLIRALAIAGAVFVAATGWSWWRFRGRLEWERR